MAKETKNSKSANPRSGRDSRNSRDSNVETVSLEDWKPKTSLGMKVKNKEINDIDAILDAGDVILEEQITESLLQLESELLLIGQS